MKKALAIIGASGHGKVVADIAVKNGYERIVFFDDDLRRRECGSFPVAGTCADAGQWDDDMIIAIGNATIRERLQERFEAMGKRLPALVHPSAVIAGDVAIGAGTVVMAGAIINPGCEIGKGCIINSNALVDHDGMIADYVHVSCGAMLAGTVHVGARTWLGIGAVVRNNIDIASDCMIGAGAVVVQDITERGTYIGVPARRMKMNEKTCVGGVTSKPAERPSEPVWQGRAA